MAKVRHNNKVTLLGFARRNRPALLMSTALQATAMLVLSLPADAQPAPNSRPTGGSVAAGSAAISYAPGNTRIDQSTQRAAINWQSFNVGSQQSVTFNQPSANAVALNRVTGPDPSQIAGRIDANGQIILTNQSGVTFYKGAQVNTNGLMVTAAGISNQNFMAGKMIFDQPAKPNARVENQGTITIKQAGLAALVAPQVVNSGTITAKLGHVVLAGAKTATLDLYGDGLLSLDVSNQVTQTPVGPDGKTATALVTNSGVIVADGGTVQLTARAADGIVQNLVQAGGRIRTATVGDQTGTVALNGVGGAIIVTGQLSAIGNATGTQGGAIEVVSNGNVGIASSARINASGKAGGGVVAIGTTLDRARGGPGVKPAMTAANVTVKQGAYVAADASGDGGRVTVLSRRTTRMDGLITAKSGPAGGNGGFVEISGENLAMTTGQADVSAPQGRAGVILLDPRDLTIVTAGANDGDVGSNGVPVGNPDQNTDITVSGTVLTSLMGNLLIEASRNLIVDTPLSFVNQTTGTSVTMLAGDNLTVNQAISMRDGDLILRAAVQTDGTTMFTHFNAAGAITINAPVTGVGASTITLSAGTGGITLGANVSGKSIDLSTTGGGITQTAGVISTATLKSTAGVTGDTTLMQTGNAVDTIGTFNVTGGSFALRDSAPLTVSGKLSATGNIYLKSTNVDLGLTVPGTVAAGATAIAGLQSDRIGITGTVTAGTVELAPNLGLVTLGGSGGLALSSTTLSRIGANLLRIGAVTIPGTGLTTTSSAISIAGTVDLVGVATTLDLESNGSVLEQSGAALLNVGTLSGASISLDITQPGNTIATIGSYTVVAGGDSGGGFKLTDTGSLAVTGPLSANNISLQTTGGGSSINVTGAISGTTSIALDSGSITLGTGADVTAPTTTLTATNGIGLTGNAHLGTTGDVVDLNSAAGGVLEAATATLDALTLQSSSGVAGGVSLLGTNHVANIGAFSTTGDFALTDASALTVAGALTATGNVYLEDSNAGGITIGSTGVVAAGSVDRASFQAAGLTIDAGGTVTGGLFEFAPDTPGTVTLGAGGSLPSLVGVGTNSVEIGGVTVPVAGFVVTATAITTTATFNGNGLPITLNTTGAITESSGAPIINVATLSGSAASVSLTQPGNLIGTLGAFGTSGGFALVDNEALTVTGPVVDTGTTSTLALTTTTGDITLDGKVDAANVVDLISAGTINQKGGTLIAGTLTGSAAVSASFTEPVNLVGTLGAFSTKNGFALVDDEALIVAGPVSDTGATTTLALTTLTGDITLTGAVSATNAVDLISAGAIIEAGGIVTAGTLTGSANGNISLLTKSNDVAAVAGLRATGGDVSLVDNAPTLTLTGAITGNNLFVELAQANGTLAIGSATAGATLNAVAASNPRITLVADRITEGVQPSAITAANGVVELAPFSLGFDVSLGGTQPAPAATLVLDSGLFGEIATGTLVVGRFTDIVNDGILATSAGTITVDGLVNMGGVANVLDLETTGAIDPLGIQTAAITNLATLTGHGTAVILNNVGNTIGTLGPFGTSAGFTLVDNEALIVAGPVTDSGAASAVTLTTKAGDITLTGSLSAANIVDLISAGSISEMGGVVNAMLLTGSAVTSASLTGANTITALGGFTANTGFALNDTRALTVNAAATVNGGTSVTITDNGALTVNGTVTGATVALSASGIDIAGAVNGSTSAALASSAGITEEGSINTALLTGSAGTSASLTGANTITALGNFVATKGFVLNDTSPLTVNAGATVNGGTSVTITDTGALAVDGAVAGATVALSGSSIDIAGAVNGSTSVALATGGGITEEGSINTALLTGSAGTSASLTGTNAITTLGDFTASQGFSLNDTPALTVGTAATVNGGTGVMITDTGALTVNGTVTGATVALSGSTIDIAGVVNGATSVALAAGAGITEMGNVTTALLTGSAGTSASLTGANAITALGDFTASQGFMLNDTPALTVNGGATVNGGTNVTIADVGALVVDGTVTGTTVALSGSSIEVAGLVNGPTSVTLTATGGGITEPGGINTALLTGSATTSVYLNGANTVTTLDNFTASQGFTLFDASPLTVNGKATVTGGTNVTITDAGALTVNGTVAGTTVELSGSSIDIAGAVNGPTIVTLTATGSGITEGGSITTALLTGSAATSASLIGANAIAALGTFNTTAGFALVDGQALTVAGPVTDTGAASTVAFTTTSGDVILAGNVTGTTIDLISAGAINQTGGALTAGTLTGSAAGAANLTQPANQIATVSNFTASGFALNDNVGLTVNGTLNGGSNVTVLDNGTLTIGAEGKVSGTAIALTAADLNIGGIVTDGGAGSVNLIANAGTISETGALTAGTLIGSSVGATNLIGTNQVSTLGNLTAAGFALNDTIRVLIAGLLNGGPTVAIQDGSSISETGAVIASTLTGSAGGSASFTGSNQINTLGNFSANGFTLNDGVSLTIAGVLNSGSGVALQDTGAISESGAILTNVLSGGATGAANFGAGANQIASLGNFTANGFTLNDGTSLAINGAVNGGPAATLGINGSLTLNGALNATTVSLTASGGAISEIGQVIANVLTGSATGATVLNGSANQVVQLDNFSSGGRFTLNDTTDLTLAGTLNAPTIVVNDHSHQITFANQATIITGGTTRPSVATPTVPNPNTSNGAFLTGGSFVQLGTSFVRGSPSIMLINVTPGAGNISFSTANGLQAPHTWLILEVGSGRATGNVTVANLDVVRQTTSGSTDLFGSVAGLNGPAAAGVSGIQPSPNSNFRFNSCPIHSVNCVLLPTAVVPTANPLNDISIGTLYNPDEQNDLLLPIVSDQDY